MPPPTGLADLLATMPTDALMGALLARDDFDDLTRRMNLIADWEKFGDEHAEDLEQADREALGLALSAQETPDVARLADLVLAEIRADMDIGRVPPDVGSFSGLHDHVDANEYLIRLVRLVAHDCSCGLGPVCDPENLIHEEDCACRAKGGSHDRHTDLVNAVMDAVDARLAAEAGGDGQPPAATVQEEVAPLKGAMTAAAERFLLPARFSAAQAIDGPATMTIRDEQSGREAVVPLFAYGPVCEALGALFPGDPGTAAGSFGPDELIRPGTVTGSLPDLPPKWSDGPASAAGLRAAIDGMTLRGTGGPGDHARGRGRRPGSAGRGGC